MANLTENERAFVQTMRKGPDQERHGFLRLAKHAEPAKFFDALQGAGLFEPDRNPQPEQGERPGTWGIRTWPALLYLKECAQHADNALGTRIMEVVRRVSAYRESDGAPRDNPTTSEALAALVGTLPTGVVTLDDIGLVQEWLSTKFDKTSLSASLDRAIGHFLNGPLPDDPKKALALMRECLAVRWVRNAFTRDDEPQPLLDRFWLGQIVKHYARILGEKLGQRAASVLREVVETVFSRGARHDLSWLFRPAVEDHIQNHDWRAAENATVEALRDSLLGWAANQGESLEKFVCELLASPIQMLRRIGIYVLDVEWARLGQLYGSANLARLFDPGHRHELFSLLKDRFSEFPEALQFRTVGVIDTIPDRNEQRRWLDALPENYAPAKERLAGIGGRSGRPPHPDFNSFIESAVGPGPSPFRPDELVAFALDGSLTEKVNAFEPPANFRRASAAGLAAALGTAVASAPNAFLGDLDPEKPGSALNLKPEYQHAIVGALRGLWQGGDGAPVEWQAAWPHLLRYFERVIERIGEMRGANGQEIQPLVASIADFLSDGARDDAHAYAPELLPRGWAVIERLAELAEPTMQADSKLDAMTAAINSPKGRVVEAMVIHALRECRVAGQNTGEHRAAWERLQPTFDKQLRQCNDGNYEFSTLAGAYIVNLWYLSEDWLRNNIDRVFPTDRTANLSCALEGLAFAHPSKDIYALLRDAGVIQRGLELRSLDSKARKVVVHYTMREYLSGAEDLDSPQIDPLFSSAMAGDLESAAWFLGGARHAQPEPTEEHKRRIVRFWSKCVRAFGHPATATPPLSLLLALGALAWTLPDASGENRNLLITAAPAMARDVHAHEFLQQLDRLADSTPRDVAEVLLDFLGRYDPTFDYDDRLKKLIQKLAGLGEREAALHACERLVSLPGIPELAARISESA